MGGKGFRRCAYYLISSGSLIVVVMDNAMMIPNEKNHPPAAEGEGKAGMTADAKGGKKRTDILEGGGRKRLTEGVNIRSSCSRRRRRRPVWEISKFLLAHCGGEKRAAPKQFF